MRKRMITPEFFSDDELVESLDIAGRMFYLGTWSVAEDSGVLLLSPLALKMKIFPGDNVSVSGIQGYIETLISIGKIVPFDADGKQYGWLRNFHKHQKLDRPSAPTLPLPAWLSWIPGEKRHESHYEITGVVDESATSQRLVIEVSATSRPEEKRRERKGNEKKIGEVNSPTVDDSVSKRRYSDEEKEPVQYLQHRLKENGVVTFSRDWHIKGYAVSRSLLKNHSVDDLKSIIEWALSDTYWCDKVDSMMTVERVCPQWEQRSSGIVPNTRGQPKARDPGVDMWEQTNVDLLGIDPRLRPGEHVKIGS